MSKAEVILIFLASFIHLSHQGFWWSDPEIEIKDIVSTSSTASVYFAYEKAEKIEKVVIGLNGKTLVTFWKPNFPANYVIRDLKPCLEYSLNYKMFPDGKTESKQFKTKPIKLQLLENIEYDESTNILSWAKPGYGQTCLAYYSIEYAGKMKKINNETLKLTDLPGCSKVMIHITPVDKFGNSGVRALKEIEVEFKEPYINDRDDITIIQSTDGINIYWNKPQRNPDCVGYYAIRYDGQEYSINSTFFKISNVEPCRTYNFDVCAIMKYNVSKKCIERDYTTEYATPEIVIGPMIIKSSSVNISLEYKHVYCIQYAQFKIYDGTSKKPFKNSQMSDYYYEDQLQACTKYTFLIRFGNIDNKLNRFTNKTFKTDAEMISSVRNIIFDPKKDMLTWDHPSFGADCVKHYLINNYHGIKEVTADEKISFSNLTGCSIFQFQITPIDDNDALKGTSVTTNIKTRFKTPNAVEITYADSISSNSITLVWNPPTINLYCVKHYTIEYNSSILSTNLTSLTISNLEPCTDYSVEICLVLTNDKNGRCTRPKSVRTQSAIAEIIVGSVFTTSFSGNMSLEFKNINCIEKLEIGLQDGKPVHLKNLKSPMYYYIDQLEPCTEYNVVFKLYGINQNVAFSTNKIFNTDSVPIDRVNNIQFDQTNNLLTWDPSIYGAQCITHYRIVFQGVEQIISANSIKLDPLPGCLNVQIDVTPMGNNNLLGANSTKYFQSTFKMPNHVEYVYTSSNDQNSVTVSWEKPTQNLDCLENFIILCNNMTLNTTVNKTTIKIDDLEPCTEYSIQICLGMTNKQVGQCSKSYKVITKSAIPEITIDTIIAESFFAIVVFKYKNKNCIAKIGAGFVGGKQTTFLKPNLPSQYVVDNLKPCTSYNFIVTGYSDYTNLVIGDRKTFWTKSIEITAVKDIKYDKMTSRLSWTSPITGSECVKNYQIDDGTNQYITPKGFYDLSYLAGCSNFSVQITAMHENGDKGVPHRKYIQTGLKEPDRVAVTSINSISPNSIRLIYNAPKQNQKCVKQYAIKYNTRIEYTNLTTYTVQNLEPCSEYSFEICVIMINNREGPCTAPKQKITTMSHPPQTTVAKIILDSSQVNVTLEYNNVNCANRIKVGLINRVSEIFAKPNLPKFYYVNMLKPCSSYVLYVNTYSDHYTEMFNVNETFETKSVLIDPVENIQFEPSTDLLIWKRPNNGAECIAHYKIDDGEKVNKTYSEFYDLHYLPGCSKYRIRVTPIGRNSKKGKENVLVIQTGLKKSDEVIIASAESTSSDSITVAWNIPRTNPNCVQGYSIIYSENSSAESTTLTRHTINNLEPCTDYNLEVCVVMINNETGLCTKFPQIISTLSNVPEIVIRSLSLGSFDANVSLAYINVNCIWYFDIGLNGEVFDVYQKPNLPAFYYAKRVIPCSENKLFINIVSTGNESFSVSEIFKSSSVHIPKVTNVEFNERNDLIQWKQPDIGAECIRWYSIDSNGITNVTSSQGINLSHLPGCAEYGIVITPHGDNGVTGDNATKYIQTGFKKPNRISNMTVFSNSPESILMTWHHPTQNPSCVANYSIVYKERREYTNLTEFTINNLKPCGKYNVSVCAVMVNNQLRVCTENYRIRTATGVPSRVQHLRYVNSSIEWEPPSYATKCIKYYILSIYDVLGRQTLSEELTATRLVFNSELLVSCQYYTVSVVSVNADGEKGDEESITFKTKAIQPGLPTAPKLISKTATSIELESNYENEHDLCSLRRAIFVCRADVQNGGVRWGNVSLVQHQKTFSSVIGNLTDLTNYACTVQISNEMYSSKFSFVSEFETAEKLSEPPAIMIGSIKSKSVSIAWKAPNKTVRLKYYHIQILKIGKNYAVPKACKNTPFVKSFRVPADTLSHEFTNLEPYTNYSLEMAIENTAGIGLYSDPLEITTKPHTPHMVKNFRIDRIYSDQTVDLKWELPCEINGKIISIKGIFYESQPPNSSVTSYEWELKSPNNLLTTDYYKENRIKPEHTYNVTIGIELENFTRPLNETIISFTSPAGIPAAYASDNWGLLHHETNPSNNVKLTVTKNLFSSAKGKIRKFTFLISERNCQEDPRPSYMFFINKFDETSTKLPTWFDHQDIECNGQYQTQEFPVQPNFEVNGFEFVIGNQICDETNKHLRYCNGPLKSGTEYAVIARVYTSIGYADTNPINFTTESSFSTVILVIFIFLLICGSIGFAIVRLKRQKADEQPAAEQSNKENIELTPTRIYSHYFKIDLDVILEEFQSINDLNLCNLTSHVAKTQKPLNRYVNILPYDQNRVHLIPNSYSPTGYINASYIDGYAGPDEYIAAQGPTPETCYDFWNMIFATNCNKVVMLTNLVENQISKCAQYYPDPNDEVRFHDITVFNVQEHTSNLYTRRELLIKNATTERLIVQYHFQSWPDHGCPENELDLINFIQLIRMENGMVALNAPIVVHCSAGVGRTGTLIALDILLQHIANNKKLNVCETVKNLRYQRVKMVQTLAQYQFVYKSVARYLHRYYQVVTDS